jgi:hypothetical protein
MNTYACWHQGIFGYCFQNPRSGWWFVPELDQPDPKVYRHLQLSDLMFVNDSDYRHEWQNEQLRECSTWRDSLRNLLFPALRARTVGGLLFLPDNR